MKAEHVNPFVTSALRVIERMTGMTPLRGALSLKERIFPALEVSVLVGLSGQVRGQVIYTMAEPTAMAVSAAMMRSPNVPVLDEMALSALGELCNMITGHAATLLEKEGLAVNVSIPTFVLGNNVRLSATGAQILTVPLQLPAGLLEINVGMDER